MRTAARAGLHLGGRRRSPRRDSRPARDRPKPDVRGELLREPVWRIALQRTQDFLFRLNIPGLASYPALATAVVVCVAVISLKVYQTPETVNVAAQNRTPVVATTVADSNWSLSNPVTTRDLGPSLVRTVKDSSKTHRVAAPPRYVLDSTPVSYEAAFRF